MQYNVLSSSGVKASRLCLGTATFGVAPGEADADSVIGRALDLGINFFDTASTYGNQTRFDRPGAPPADQRESAEEILGRALKGHRDEVVLASKVSEKMGEGPNDGGFGAGGLSRLHIMRLLERSLRRLGTDHIDIYYAHHPDRLTDIADTISTFEDLIRQGKIRYWALSTYKGWQLTEAVLTADRLGARRPIIHQTAYNVAMRGIEDEILPASNRFGISTVLFSPLAGGLLASNEAAQRQYSGSVRWGGAGFTEAQLDLGRRFIALAESWGQTPAHVALAWLLQQPGVASAIIGPESIAELETSAPAGDLMLDPEQLKAITDLTAVSTAR